jgi:hypothetical protein
MTMRTLIALLAIAGSALAQDITITTTVTIGQQNMLGRVVKRMNAEGVSNLINQFPNATIATNVNGNVTARIDGALVGNYMQKTVPQYALMLSEAAIRSVSRQELDAKRAEVAAAYDAADAATKKTVEDSLKVTTD